jgi:hypothetical protein
VTAVPREAALGFEPGGAGGLLDTPYRTHITWCRRVEV